MKKMVRVLFGLGILIFLVLIIYSFNLAQNTKIKNSFTITQTTAKPHLTNISWLPNDNNCEHVAGWLGSRILINYISNPNDSAVYIFDPQHGKKELITKHGGYSGIFNGYTKINLFALSDQRILLHYNYIDNMLLQSELNDINGIRGDYTYSTIENTVPKDNWLRKLAVESAEDYDSKDKETKSKIEIYNLKSKKSEKIFQYKSKYRTVGKGKCTPVNSFQSIGYSNNSKFICWCMEVDPGTFTFSIYNVASKAIKEYKITEDEGRFNFISNLSVSNDGDTLWFTGGPVTNYLANNPKAGTNIFKLDLNTNKIVPELIAEDAITYKTSFDNRFIVYEKLINDKQILITLNCLNLDSMNEIIIDDNIMTNVSGCFDLSNFDNTVSYLKKDLAGAKVYVVKLDSPSNQPALIYSLQEVEAVNCIHIGQDNKKLLISFDLKENERLKHNTCVMDISW